MLTIVKEYINKILNYIIEKRGFDFKGYSYEMLDRRISKRISKHNCEDYSEYLKILYENEKEIDALISKITINVSNFFRDPLMYEILADYLIPNLLVEKKNKNSTHLRIWSAACSEGQEAYSVAIIGDDLIKNDYKDFEISIFATDIDDIVLCKAQLGEYHSSDLVDTKNKYISTHFVKSGEIYRISEAIKSKVEFSKFDLLDKKLTLPPVSVYGNFDIILLRNVLIYYSVEYQNQMLNKVYNSLSKNGILILGDTELLTEKFRDKFNRVGNFSKIFKKIN
ncbi:MAG: protein-glutamate O-methyltransferase CheR [Salinivirgaceae bacterium]|nr:protein-glutamate O-methyltransferase CheR [Salinivirgaceae bacterium]